MITTAGIINIVPIDVNPCQSTWVKVKNSETVTGRVFEVARVNTRANKNSFHDQTKERMAAAASPGATFGRRTRLKSPNHEQPSILAASSRSRGTA